MIYKSHNIEIFVNGQRLELVSQDSLNLRFNNVISSPEKISTTQAEYSFEFDVPSTPINDKIFDYANNLSKLNKFHNRYDAEVYGDGTLIFRGSLTLNSVKNKTYSCNLVSVKLFSLEDIFGDMTMDKIKWEIPFEGATSPGTQDINTINYYNMRQNPEVVFPLASYGTFKKDPYFKDDVASDFTSKFDLDKWNRWYIETFYPSPNVLITLKKAFETVDYTVTGDAFVNPWLTKIYASGNLANEQSPIYNIGNPNFGQADITMTLTTEGSGYEQELAFPYFKVDALISATDPQTGAKGISATTEYNWTDINLYNFMEYESGVTVNQPICYMYQPDEHCIVIPADGFYQIEMSVSTTLNTTEDFTAKQYWLSADGKNLYESNITMPVGLRENTPIEIALVRNYADNYELIKGRKNKKYLFGNPNVQTQVKEWLSCFPHEDAYNAELPTKQNDLTLYNTTTRFKGVRGSDSSGNYQGERGSTSSSSSGGGSFGGRRAPASETRGGTNGHGTPTRPVNRKYNEGAQGYVYKMPGDTEESNYAESMAYDQVVSPAFICGFSSFLDGCTAVMKNGYSWSKSNSDKNEAFYIEPGYWFLENEKDISGNVHTSYSATSHNKNLYINAPVPTCNVSNTMMNGTLNCAVRLNKDDKLELFAIQRGYHNTDDNVVLYSTTSTVHLKIKAFSPRDYYHLQSTNDGRYDAPTEFPVNLQVANFFNKETLVSDWVQGVLDAFNLQLTQNGNSVDISTKKNFTSNYAINIDDRVNTAEAEASRIDYPRSMAVKYRIDDDEWGFERSAIDNGANMNNDDWKKYADSGYTEIMLNDDSYVTNKSEKSLPFSYTWYDTFKYYNVNREGEQTTTDPVLLRLPVISNYSYMIDGYDYEKSMKYDGYGLPQRFWFRPLAVTIGSGQAGMVWTETYPRQYVLLYRPTNVYNGLNLSYKTSERSLLEFFNIKAYLASNYVSVEVYLTPEEYQQIKDGALIKFDSDLYIPVEIQGYDPAGENKTKLTMMKKVI